jgi:hypothetical protein
MTCFSGAKATREKIPNIDLKFMFLILEFFKGLLLNILGMSTILLPGSFPDLRCRNQTEKVSG